MHLLQIAQIPLVFIMLMPWTEQGDLSSLHPSPIALDVPLAVCYLVRPILLRSWSDEKGYAGSSRGSRNSKCSEPRYRTKSLSEIRVSASRSSTWTFFSSFSSFFFFVLLLCLAQSFYVLCSQCGVFSQSGPRLTWADNRTITEQDSHGTGQLQNRTITKQDNHRTGQSPGPPLRLESLTSDELDCCWGFSFKIKV